MSMMTSENECKASHGQEKQQMVSLLKIQNHMDTDSVDTHLAYRGTNGDQ